MDDAQIYRDALGRFQQDKEKRESEQKRQRLEAEAELLDTATTQREYNERRNALRECVLQPNIPPDEMTMADYMKFREPRKTYAWTHAAYLQAVRDSKK
jgi:hypothetical protein